MLDEYKNLYCECANNYIKGWKEIDKNQLCNLYIEHENDSKLSQAYLSAIIYKYWKLIPKFYSISYNVVQPEDVYEWLLSSILYALKHRSWLKKDSSIYMDKNGPDKVINRCMKCRRFTYYQAINRKKRKGGFGNLSLDQMTDELNDSLNCVVDKEDAVDRTTSDYDFMLNEYIKFIYIHDCPFNAFVLDIIAYKDPFDSIIGEDGRKTFKFNIFNVVDIFGARRKLLSENEEDKPVDLLFNFADDLPPEEDTESENVDNIKDATEKKRDRDINNKNINLTYPPYFSAKYGIEIESVCKNWEECCSLSNKELFDKISGAIVNFSALDYFKVESGNRQPTTFVYKMSKKDSEALVDIW